MSFRSQTNYHHLPRILWYAQQKRQLRFAKQAFFILFFATQYNTVEPLLKHISIIWTPLYYARFCLSKGHQLHTRIKPLKKKRGHPREEDTREERGLPRARPATQALFTTLNIDINKKQHNFRQTGSLRFTKYNLSVDQSCQTQLKSVFRVRIGVWMKNSRLFPKTMISFSRVNFIKYTIDWNATKVGTNLFPWCTVSNTLTTVQCGH